jgi:LysM repeat protein
MRTRYLVGVLVFILTLVPPLAVGAQGGGVHVVQPGESLSGIARIYGVSASALANANGLPNPNYIYVGQRLNIPAGDDTTIHIVAAGDTLFGIALRYGVTPAQVAAANGLYDPGRIYIGQRLRIPAGALPTPLPTPTPQPTVTPTPAPCRCEEIVINGPAPHITVTNPVTVTGLAAGFEQTVVVAMLDGSGTQIGLTPASIVGPYGQQGAFTVALSFSQPANSQPGRIQVWSVSPRDGAIEHLASVSVQLQGVDLDALLEQLEAALRVTDRTALQRLMTNPFRWNAYKSISRVLTPAEAMEQLQRNWPATAAPRLDFSVDARRLLGQRVTFGPEILHVVYSPGWGTSGRDDTFWLMGAVAGRARWTGLIYVPRESIDYR